MRSTKHTSPRFSLRRGTLVAVAAAAFALSACGDSTKRALGLSRTAPDEFQVVTRAPLTQPPDYKLRPPRPGADSPAAVSTREQARQAVFRADDSSSRFSSGANDANAPQAAPRGEVVQRTRGESAFLSQAGALDVDSSIRTQVDRETAVLGEANKNFVRDLLGLEQDPVDEVVDAPAESRRLRENQALGKPAGEGETPVIERRANSILSIF